MKPTGLGNKFNWSREQEMGSAKEDPTEDVLFVETRKTGEYGLIVCLFLSYFVLHSLLTGILSS